MDTTFDKYFSSKIYISNLINAIGFILYAFFFIYSRTNNHVPIFVCFFLFSVSLINSIHLLIETYKKRTSIENAKKRIFKTLYEILFSLVFIVLCVLMYMG